MNRFSFFVLVLLSAVFLGLLAPYIVQPALYTLQNDSATSFHTNPAALEQISQERSAELSNLMQELLDSPQPVVLNIRIRDFEEAQRAFDEYKEKSRSFDNIVVSLELSESAVGDFQRENRKNMAALERMINESARFAEINQLEIRYRSEDNPALLYTLTYEGEAVQQALAEVSGELREREPDILDISGELGLNTTRYREAVELLREIVDESQREQEVRAGNQPELSRSSLTLAVTPASGRYGDTLQVTGAYSFIRLPQVTLVLDSRDWKTLTPDEGGVFATPLPIGRIRAGDHVIFANSGPLYSNIVTFTVLPTETTITLETQPGGAWDQVLCSGSLYAGEIPVRNAPVRVMIDGNDAQLITTSEEGTYSVTVVLTEGEHTLQAVFDDPAYPLLPASSTIRSLSVSPRASLPLTLLVGGGILALASAGAGWYLVKGRRRVIPASTSGEPARIAETGPEKEPLSPSPLDVLIRYLELFEVKRWSEAAQVLYVSLRDRLAHRAAPRLSRAMTVREFAGIFSATALAAPFRSFVARYEEVRYGGSSLAGKDPLLSFWNTILSLIEEGRHE